jgi:hypothetical protein
MEPENTLKNLIWIGIRAVTKHDLATEMWGRKKLFSTTPSVH